MGTSKPVKICAICGYPVYWDDPKVMAKPQKGRTAYAHLYCLGGADYGEGKESR